MYLGIQLLLGHPWSRECNVTCCIRPPIYYQPNSQISGRLLFHRTPPSPCYSRSFLLTRPWYSIAHHLLFGRYGVVWYARATSGRVSCTRVRRRRSRMLVAMANEARSRKFRARRTFPLLHGPFLSPGTVEIIHRKWPLLSLYVHAPRVSRPSGRRSADAGFWFVARSILKMIEILRGQMTLMVCVGTAAVYSCTGLKDKGGIAE